jgi:hypothetical protein
MLGPGSAATCSAVGANPSSSFFFCCLRGFGGMVVAVRMKRRYRAVAESKKSNVHVVSLVPHISGKRDDKLCIKNNNSNIIKDNTISRLS